MMAASRPTRKPPLQRACKPFERSAIVAYKPLPIFRMDAKPLSAMGCAAMRGSSSSGRASAGNGRAIFAAAYSAPSDDAPARKFRRENGFEKLFMGFSNDLWEEYWFRGRWAMRFLQPRLNGRGE